MTDPDLTTFQKRLAERRAREAAAKVAEEQKHQYDEDLIPEASDGYELSEAEMELDKFVENIDIIDAYNRWCRKMRPEVRKGQREGIKISCPNPSHPDRDPSAWINLDKQTWYCGGCAEGGDAHDIAAWHFGYSVPAYKNGSDFHTLRRQMAEDFGLTVTRTIGGSTVVTPPPTGETEEHSGGGEESSPESVEAQVVDLYDDGDLDVQLPGLNWRDVIGEDGDTFLHEYMKACVIDDSPEEYHFFHALLAIGFALGRDVKLYDGNPVHGNLFICLLGPSGAGKSRATKHLNSLMRMALPEDWSNPASKGVSVIQGSASAEVLIHSFQKPVEDPTNPKKVAYYAPVKGFITYGEFSDLMIRAGRQGNNLLPILMQFYDADDHISTRSLTHGIKSAENSFASALTTTQPKSLRTLLKKGDDSSGFLNRWVFVSGTLKERVVVGGEMVDITPAVKPLQDILGWAASFKTDEVVQWSPEALERFVPFVRDQVFKDRDKVSREGSEVLGRLDLLMKKLVLLFTANLKQRSVPVEAVDMAIAMYEFIVKSYQVPTDQIGNNLAQEVLEAVRYQLQKQAERNGQGLSPAAINKALKRRKYPLDLIIKTLKNMVDLQEVVEERPNAGKVGRPTVRYKYVG